MTSQDYGASSKRARGRPRLQHTGAIREALIESVVELVGKAGATDTTLTRVAEHAGVSPSTINYHFGSLDGLIAEAALVVYADYSERRWAMVWEEDRDARKRLRLYVLSQQTWAQEKPGWAAFFNFPSSANRASNLMFEHFGNHIKALFDLNYARLYRLALDVHEGQVCADPEWAQKADPAEIMSDERLLAEVIVLGWIALGMVVWSARNQTEQLGGRSVAYFNDVARELALQTTIERLQSLPSAR